MAEKPIIFSAPMVRALLAGTKTQTRRILKPQPLFLTGQRKRVYADADWRKSWREGGDDDIPYSVGDRLWVKEGWAAGVSTGNSWHADSGPGSPSPKMQRRYRADGEGGFCGKWRSPRFMPLWASRITLEVTEVRIQRLQEISGEDTIVEGVQCTTCEAMKYSACHDSGCFHSLQLFKELWNGLHGPDAWAANPWVAAISFKRIT